jgi:NADH-quinone oxidoreductase subunit N
MNLTLIGLELGVLILALGVLLLDLWMPAERKAELGHLAAFGVGMILLSSFLWPVPTVRMDITPVAGTNDVATAPAVLATPPAAPGAATNPPAGPLLDVQVSPATFTPSFVVDDLALFFKRFFLLAALIVLLMAAEFSSRIPAGISEFHSLILFALAGMMFAASANDFAMLFVSIELITITFYVLTSFQRNRLASLEAGVKYLILGALASAFMVYGLALVYGTAGTMQFPELAVKAKTLSGQPLFLLGLLLVLAGLAFKIAAFPLQIWAPDVYQGSPAPVTAFLAVGSKAAGMVLLIRVVLGSLPPEITGRWKLLLMIMSAVTILYGSLCAIPQRNLKRLLGYSSIANAGYLLLGIAAVSNAGVNAILFYLGGYLFTVLAAFAVLCVVLRAADVEDISGLAGLHQRSPLLAGAMTLAMVSLAGVPPLAGFFGKFLLLRAVIEQGPAYYWLVAVALVGVVISLYYYFGVIRAIYWSPSAADLSPLSVSTPLKVSLAGCIAGMLVLGVYPNSLLRLTSQVIAP